MKTGIVLHVEDDANDVFFVQRAFEKAQLAVKLQRLEDGQQALEYLAGTGCYRDRGSFPLPELMLLDLKLPLLSGFEVLEWARAREEFRELPICILSSSDQAEDIARAKQLGADRYFVKTPTYADVVEVVEEVLGGAKIGRAVVAGGVAGP